MKILVIGNNKGTAETLRESLSEHFVAAAYYTGEEVVFFLLSSQLMICPH